MHTTQFWIATPSFNSLKWLPLAVASVADQASDGVMVHHHIQDGGSTDGTREWLENYAQSCARTPRAGYSFSYESGSDDGMYDALNIAWGKAPKGVDFLGHLNSDEQYLPGALRGVAEGFAKHPAWELLLADMIVVDSEARYICHRRSLAPSGISFRYTCGGMTATTFQRASVFQNRGIRFDTNWRVIGDKVWYCAMYDAGVIIGCWNQMVSVFTETGANLGWSTGFQEEAQRYADLFLGGDVNKVRLVSKWNGLRRVIKEWRLKSPKSYLLYTTGSMPSRIELEISNPRVAWGKKF